MVFISVDINDMTIKKKKKDTLGWKMDPHCNYIVSNTHVITIS